MWAECLVRPAVERCQLVHVRCQAKIEIADSAGIVSAKADIDCSVDVFPIRMVVQAFRNQGHACHPSEGGHEVVKFEGTMQAAFARQPAIEPGLGQSSGDLLFAKALSFWGHRPESTK